MYIVIWEDMKTAIAEHRKCVLGEGYDLALIGKIMEDSMFCEH